jgi:hypothetical protein
MNDIWNFILSLGDGLQDSLAAVNLMLVLLIGLVIGIFQQKNDSLALKALLTVLGAYAVSIFLPRLTGDPLHIPDFRRLAAIVQVVMMYVFAYGVVGVVGTTKTAMKFQAKKA